MAKVLVVFGSKSDADVYSRVIGQLRSDSIDHVSKVLSAHRTPDELEQAVKEGDFDVVIAGAGLSAALPGVVASKTTKPVIGVPVHSNYSGLDALLSIMQMPPGIPVLSVGVNQAEIAARGAKNMLVRYSKVNIIGKKDEKAVKKATDVLDRLGISYGYADKPEKDAVNIEFTYFDEPIEKKDELVIYCPMLLKDDDKAEAALNILKHSDHGLWVGLNRGDNAAIAACEIMNIDGKYTDKLDGLRKEGRQKVLEG